MAKTTATRLMSGALHSDGIPGVIAIRYPIQHICKPTKIVQRILNAHLCDRTYKFRGLINSIQPSSDGHNISSLTSRLIRVKAGPLESFVITMNPNVPRFKGKNSAALL